MVPTTTSSSDAALEHTPQRSPWRMLCRWLWRLLLLALLVLLIIAGAAFNVYETRLKPKTKDEWIYTLQVSTLQIPISVPKAISWASSPRIGPWLDGLKKTSKSGQFSLAWDASTQSLLLTCQPCTSHFKSLSATPISVDKIQLSIHQENLPPIKEQADDKTTGPAAPKTLSGQALLGEKHPVMLAWEGELDTSATGLNMRLMGDGLDIAAIYHIVTPPLKELATAQITGTLDIDAKISLPTFMLSLSNIQIHNFTVTGLGTQELLGSTTSCGPISQLPMDSWLVRAVISAEDQRFERHPGYDLEELMLVHAANRDQGGIVRGASTLSQQTAKLIYTGAEKTLTRKMRELLYAVEMEQTLGKTRIMQLYLDNAPWGIDQEGRIVCGAEAVSRYFFNVSAKDLKPTEAVWLAAMLHSPVHETKRWQETGRINLNRAIWIADYVRGAENSGPQARQRVIAALKRDPSLGMSPQAR